MSNYLEEVELKRERKEYLESYYVGKKSLILYLKESSKSSGDYSNKYYSIVLEQLKITAVDDDLNIIGIDNNFHEFHIKENIANKIIILNLEDLKTLLLSLFMKNEYVEITKYPTTIIGLFSTFETIDKINLYKLFVSKEVGLDEIEKYLYSYVPYLKTGIGENQPFILCFDKKTNEICLKKTSASPKGILIDSKDIESVDDFKNGFYYGLDEIHNIVNDIVSYYNEYFTEKTTLKKFIEKIFSF